MSANDRQVGGDHYKKHGQTGEQHWDRQFRLFGPAYFIGCITKYVERYQDKNGIQDLEKAKHFIEKLIELEQGSPVQQPPQSTTPLREPQASWGWRCPGCDERLYSGAPLHLLKDAVSECPICKVRHKAPERPWACANTVTDIPKSVVGKQVTPP